MKDYQWIPLVLGTVIGLISMWVNRVTRNQEGGLASWTGWVGAMAMRIVGLLGSALFLLVYFRVKELPKSHWGESLLWLFGTLVAGLILDLVFSLRKLGSKKG